jgi:4-amino-4-deoxy-L-arabinose transferase-like glycosyltransferase
MTESLSPDRPVHWPLAVILCLALAVRLYWILVADPTPKLTGGDALLYLRLGQGITSGESLFQLLVSGLSAVGLAYPAYLAWWYLILPADSAVMAARLGQAVMDVVTCGLVFDLGRRVFDERVGLLAALVMAVDLRFITQTGAINTETLFILLLVAGVWLFVTTSSSASASRLILANVVLLLAAFTRAIALLLLPLFNALLMFPKPTKKQLKVLAAVAAILTVFVGGWGLRVYLLEGRFVFVSTGLESNFWMGSRSDGQWHGILAFDEERKELQSRYGGRDAYVEDALRTIAADPAAYVRLLFKKVTAAYLQPHGTVTFPGESLKEMAVSVLRGQMTLGQLINGTAFWPKLYIYILHFAGLVGGLAGLWLSRRNWPAVLPLVIPIVYLTAVYTFLTIIPRYIFPAMPFYTILASYAAIKLAARHQPAKERMPDSQFAMQDTPIEH